VPPVTRCCLAPSLLLHTSVSSSPSQEPSASTNRSSRRHPLPMLRAPLHRRPTPTSAWSSHHLQELCTGPSQLHKPRAGAIDLRPTPPLPNPLRPSRCERLHVHHRLRPRTTPAAASTSSAPMHSPSPATLAPPVTTDPRPRRRLLPVQPHHRGQPRRPLCHLNRVPPPTSSCPSHRPPSAIAIGWLEPAEPPQRCVCC
jgi:hypothetical protein